MPEQHGVRFYNDSKSTTPEAVRLAIDAVIGTEGRDRTHAGLHLILGGYDKGSDLSGMARGAAGRATVIYTIGATGEGIAEAVPPVRSHGHRALDPGAPWRPGS